jgi:hypothetical protein
MNSEEIQFIKIKDLPIYAASGLAKSKNSFYVVSDDERSIFQFQLNDHSFKETLLHPTVLPTDHQERKRLKPDWEALVYFQDLNALLAVPSGSKANRQTGYFIQLDANPIKPIPVDFAKIYQKLQHHFDELNIEGAVVLGSTFKLLQRGNGKSKQNAIITFNLHEILQGIQSSQSLPAQLSFKIQSFTLPELDGSAFSFTDGFALDHSLFFLAVCEETISTYEDGPYKGALLGQIDQNEKIKATWKLHCPFKPEGLWMEKTNESYQVYLVTDADSREQVSSLFVGKLQR